MPRRWSSWAIGTARAQVRVEASIMRRLPRPPHAGLDQEIQEVALSDRVAERAIGHRPGLARRRRLVMRLTVAVDAHDEIARRLGEEFELPPHHAALHRVRELTATISARASGSPATSSMKESHRISFSGSVPGLTRPKSSKRAAAWRTGIV